jgi:hypothetical protein
MRPPASSSATHDSAGTSVLEALNSTARTWAGLDFDEEQLRVTERARVRVLSYRRAHVGRRSRRQRVARGGVLS